MREVMDRLHEITREPGVLDATVFATQPWLDVVELGWTAVVIADGDEQLAQERADELATMMWDRRERVLFAKTPVHEVLDEVRASGREDRPFVVADGSDSPSAGSTGDGVVLLEALMADPIDDSVLLTVTDAQAGAACFAAGVNAEIAVDVGGSLAPAFFRPVTVTGRVVTLCDGKFRSKYPPKRYDSGRTAVLQIDSITLVITALPTFMLDQQLYLRVGLNPAEAKIVQVKSAGGYHAYYEPIAWKCVDIETPGPADSRLPRLPFTKPRRPLWPFDRDIAQPW